jgi:hypothetical protein
VTSTLSVVMADLLGVFEKPIRLSFTYTFCTLQPGAQRLFRRCNLKRQPAVVSKAGSHLGRHQSPAPVGAAAAAAGWVDMHRARVEVRGQVFTGTQVVSSLGLVGGPHPLLQLMGVVAQALLQRPLGLLAPRRGEVALCLARALAGLPCHWPQHMWP